MTSHKKSPEQHSWYEDIFAMLLGLSLISFGVVMYLETQVFTGGMAGFSLLLQYATGWEFSTIFFIANLPFYILAFLRMGLLFTFKTFLIVTLISVFSKILPIWVQFSELDPLFASVFGGLLIGSGILFLFRHRAGVGGMSIFAQFLQDKNLVNAGYFMLGFDVLVLVSGFFVLPWESVLISIAGAVATNLVIAVNHRPGRYTGMSIEKHVLGR
ncbi:YitT family protein [Hirschia litorea]|uniref:YitT family protein n=1 Tax=Hirschia litorea TaxID=1199156 RepID=A0ABW2IKI2_9PROT